MKRSIKHAGGNFEYALIRTHRRDLLLKALPGGETRVYAPMQTHLRDIDALVQERIALLQDMHNQLETQLARNRLMHPVAPGSRICIEGRAYALVLKKAARTSMKLNEAECTLSLSEPQDENAIRAALRRVLSERALERIRERLNEYAPRLGVSFSRVTIREQRTRWGSCSGKHNLNFNWKLIMAPPEALDYVVVHELCHLIEFNHSERFWKLVTDTFPEYVYWKKWLKDHGRELGVE